VTGVSTGALMATHAFLGSEFDDGLQIFRRVNTEDILRPRGFLAALTQDALFDSEPLRERLLEYLTDDVLDAVVREYTEGAGSLSARPTWTPTPSRSGTWGPWRPARVPTAAIATWT